MKKRVLQAALRVALIIEEFSDEEIREAVMLLEENGASSALLSYLTGDSDPRAKTSDTSKQRRLAASERRSLAVAALEEVDPEKYRILSEFETSLRKGDIHPDLAVIRQVGAKINKNFPSRPSRQEQISKLMELLAEQPIEVITDTIKTTVLLSHPNDTEYEQLANFIIKGATNK